MRLFLLLLVLATSCLAQGGPPLLTDDPGTPGNGNWEINLAATMDRHPDEHRIEGPLLDINYGLGSRIQLKLELPWVYRSAQPEGSQNGIGNTLLGLKWRFYQNEKHGLEISTYPQLEFNNSSSNADKGLVEKGTRFLMPLEVTKTVGPINLNTEVGLWLSQYGSNEWLAGLAAGRQMTKRLELLAEFYNTGNTDLSVSESTLGGGGRYKLRNHVVLLFMAGRGVREVGTRGPHTIGYLGLQFLLPPNKHIEGEPTGVPEPN